jgi:photosystem II stability/assembly factor-like uncharacterized protein
MYGGLLYKSSDGGGHWSTIFSTNLAESGVYALAIDPQNPANLYAGTYHGIYNSVDGGVNWSPLNDGLANSFISVLAIDPAAPANVYAGTVGGGLYVLEPVK